MLAVYVDGTPVFCADDGDGDDTAYDNDNANRHTLFHIFISEEATISHERSISNLHLYL